VFIALSVTEIMNPNSESVPRETSALFKKSSLTLFHISVSNLYWGSALICVGMNIYAPSKKLNLSTMRMGDGSPGDGGRKKNE
jgi:hypothetical protein